MDHILFGEKLFTLYEYQKEDEFERQVVAHARAIFGPDSLYIDVKKRIGDNIVTIPDGYLLDFSFPHDPRLYIIENELVKHDPYRHIGQQLLRFAISYKASGRRIKGFLLDEVMKDADTQRFVEERAKWAGTRNIDAFFEEVIFEKPVAAIVVIDASTPELENVLAQLTMNTDIVEFRAYQHKDERLHQFTPFQQEVRAEFDNGSTKPDINELDTIVVPANAEGFNEVFLGEDCWYAIRMSSSMLDKVHFIAAYQTAPISAITHYAEVANIEKYKDTNKYIVYFKETAKEVGPIKLPKNTSGLAPQAPRYTSVRRLLAAKTMKDVF